MSALSFLKEHDVVLTIGSGSVSGAVVELGKADKPKILFTHESCFPVKAEVEAMDLTTYMLSAIHKCLTGLNKDHKRRIRKVHVVLASPWFSSFSKTITLKKPAPFVVSSKVVDALVSEYFETLSKTEAGTQNFLVERHVSHLRLNGYETLNPYGQSAESLDVSVYASLAATLLKEEIESEIYSVIHPHEITFHTFPFVAWNVLNKIFAPKEDIVFVDIGSETTDLLIVRRGSIEKSGSLPIGINHLHRKIALSLDTYPELAHSLVSLYSSDLAEAGVKEKIQTLVNAFGEEWGVQFFQIFDGKEKDRVHFLPQRAFFVSDRHAHIVFEEVIKKQITDTIALTRENIGQFVDFNNDYEPNIFLVLAAVYITGFNMGF